MKHVPTNPPPPNAWLLLLRCQDRWLVQGVFDAPHHPEVLRELADAERLENEMRVVLGDPSLDVLHHGLCAHTPAWLTARDQWFQRYQAKLEPYLVAPRVAQVFTFSPGKLVDPLSSFKAGVAGPCPLPPKVDWPLCGYCQTRMVMVGVLDFRRFDAVKVPRGSLVLHGCPECGFCADRETWSIHWLIEGEPLEIYGDVNAAVELGTRWWVTEYPTPSFDEIDLLFPRPRFDVMETSVYSNFSCPTDKVGGHDFWIQGDEDFKKEYRDDSYVYIGQMTGEDESLCHWDSPIVYLMHSPTTGKTIASVQSF